MFVSFGVYRERLCIPVASLWRDRPATLQIIGAGCSAHVRVVFRFCRGSRRVVRRRANRPSRRWPVRGGSSGVVGARRLLHDLRRRRVGHPCSDSHESEPPFEMARPQHAPHADTQARRVVHDMGDRRPCPRDIASMSRLLMIEGCPGHHPRPPHCSFGRCSSSIGISLRGLVRARMTIGSVIS